MDYIIKLNIKVLVLFSLQLISSLIWSGSEVFAQSYQWAAQMGGIGTGTSSPDEKITDVAVDQWGNSYVTGVIYSGSKVNGLPISAYGAVNYGGGDMFVAKFNCHGQCSWLKTAGQYIGSEQGRALVYDSTSNHLYLTANIINAIPSNPFYFFGDTISDPTGDLFVIKFDTSGSVIWRTIAAPGLNTTSGALSWKMEQDINGHLNVFFICNSATPRMFFPGDTIGRGTYFQKFDTAGVPVGKSIWLTGWENYASTNHFVINDNLDKYLIFNFFSDSILVGNQMIYNYNSNYSDLIIAKFNDSGTLLWYKQITDTVNTTSSSTSPGDIKEIGNDFYVTGTVAENLVFGNDTIRNDINPFIGSDACVIKISSNGVYLGAKNFSARYGSQNQGGLATYNGDVYFTGSYSGDGALDNITLPNSGLGTNIALAKLDTNLNIDTAYVLSSTSGVEDIYSMVADKDGNLYMGGTFETDITINGTTYTSEGGYTDALLVKFGTVCTVGINEETVSKNKTTLTAYPNPATDIITISSVLLKPNNTISIFNINGQVILKQRITTNSDKLSLNIKTLTPGIYVIKLDNGTVGYETVRFVKQ